MKLGAIEAGGTKMVCGVFDGNGTMLDRAQFPTRTPETTMSDIIQYFKGSGIQSLGIASFGPLDLNRSSSTYGYIKATPKPGWREYPILETLRQELKVPIEIDTDVNGAALGEAILGAGKGCQSLVYYTVGTGIGGGVFANGKLQHGLTHPEIGHILLQPMSIDPSPKGFCPFHEGCLEGLASGTAIEKRWGKNAKELPDTHPAWKIEAEYLAQMCMNTILMLSPERIVLGGGVMHKEFLFPMVRERTIELLNGYVSHNQILNDIDSYIVPPVLGDNAGLTGAMLLAQMALQN